jgi:hypothetical protein
MPPNSTKFGKLQQKQATAKKGHFAGEPGNLSLKSASLPTDKSNEAVKRRAKIELNERKSML